MQYKVILFLDYDGTLTPIVKSPRLARLKPGTRQLIKKLSKKVILCIISGRSLKDIKKLIGLPNIIYAGNHGLEIDCHGKILINPSALKFRQKLDKILAILKEKLKDIPGIFIEDKGVTLSIHYRNVKNRYHGRIRRVFKISPLTHPSPPGERVRVRGARITQGKKVFEVRPPVKWDKGMAVKRILNLSGRKLLPIYIGDDTTDEDAFRMLKDKGITIFVGKQKKSNAEYYLKNTREVIGFLRRIYGAI